MQNDWIKAENILKKGGIAVIPTDTLYGIVTSVFNKKSIEKIYKTKNRGKDKPLIVLISSVKQLKDFGIKEDYSKIFIPHVSFLISVSNKFKCIHRGTNEIAFRLIGKKNKNLFNFINQVGPIVAPSANPEGEKPAENLIEARKYFGDKIDIYVNGGKKIGDPSTLVRVLGKNIEILRQGRVKIKSDN